MISSGQMWGSGSHDLLISPVKMSNSACDSFHGGRSHISGVGNLLELVEKCFGCRVSFYLITSWSSFTTWYRKLQNFVSLQLGTGVLPKKMHGIVFDFVSSVVGVAVVGTLPTGQWCGKSSELDRVPCLLDPIALFVHSKKAKNQNKTKVTYHSPRYFKVLGNSRLVKL